MIGTVLGVEDMIMTKTDKICALMDYILVGEKNINKINV